MNPLKKISELAESLSAEISKKATKRKPREEKVDRSRESLPDFSQAPAKIADLNTRFKALIPTNKKGRESYQRAVQSLENLILQHDREIKRLEEETPSLKNQNQLKIQKENRALRAAELAHLAHLAGLDHTSQTTNEKFEVLRKAQAQLKPKDSISKSLNIKDLDRELTKHLDLFSKAVEKAEQNREQTDNLVKYWGTSVSEGTFMRELKNIGALHSFIKDKVTKTLKSPESDDKVFIDTHKEQLEEISKSKLKLEKKIAQFEKSLASVIDKEESLKIDNKKLKAHIEKLEKGADSVALGKALQLQLKLESTLENLDRLHHFKQLKENLSLLEKNAALALKSQPVDRPLFEKQLAQFAEMQLEL